MSELTNAIESELQLVIKALENHIGTDEPISVAHNTWQFANVTKAELVDYVTELIELCNANKSTSISESDALILSKLVKRLSHLRQHNVPQIWSNAQYALPAFTLSMDATRRQLSKVFKDDVGRQLANRQKRQLEALNGFEKRQKDMTERIAQLDDMLTRIEDAHEAATHLPETLDNLRTTNNKINKAQDQATDKLAEIERHRSTSDQLIATLRKQKEEATGVLEKCHTAYSSANSQGLANAFSNRSNELKATMFFWVGGLILALLIGGLVGGTQLNSLIGLFQVGANANVITANIVLAIISVGAPVWFAWLSTRQIGQNFRLAEDYAFKASVSSAYEGYRRETEKFKDSGLPQKLLASALTRLDEEPLRVISDNTPGSPLHDLLNSDAIKKAFDTVPDFTKQVIDLAQNSVKTFVGADSSAKPKRTPDQV